MNNPQITKVAIGTVFSGAKRRKLAPKWVVTIAESMNEIGLINPIEIVQDGSGCLLISGAHRLAAAAQLGWDSIPAIIKSALEVQTATDIKLREISENLIRNNLSILDRSFDMTEWRDFYTANHEMNKGGRPKTTPKEAWAEELSTNFALSFSDAAQATLNISRTSVFNYLRVASIGEDMRQRISLHPTADNLTELLALAAEPEDRRTKIVDILTAEEPKAATVAGAIAIIDEVPAATRVERWQKIYTKFSVLKEREQHQFFEANASAINDWLEARKN